MKGVIVVIVGALMWGMSLDVFAECAWIFWERMTLNTYRSENLTEHNASWKLHKAYTSAHACEAAKMSLWAHDDEQSRLKDDGSTNVTSIPGELVSIKMGAAEKDKSMLIEYVYHCIPDTIDPRK